jgi:hypothetical protein
MRPLLATLKKYLNTQGDALLQPTMLVAVNLQHFMLLRDYTTSKTEILAALNPWRGELYAARSIWSY